MSLLRGVREEKVLSEKSDEFGGLMGVEGGGLSLLRPMFVHQGLLPQIEVFSVSKDELREV